MSIHAHNIEIKKIITHMQNPIVHTIIQLILYIDNSKVDGCELCQSFACCPDHCCDWDTCNCGDCEYCRHGTEDENDVELKNEITQEVTSPEDDSILLVYNVLVATAVIINGKETNIAAGSGLRGIRWLQQQKELINS